MAEHVRLACLMLLALVLTLRESCDTLLLPLREFGPRLEARRLDNRGCIGACEFGIGPPFAQSMLTLFSGWPSEGLVFGDERKVEIEFEFGTFTVQHRHGHPKPIRQSFRFLLQTVLAGDLLVQRHD